MEYYYTDANNTAQGPVSVEQLEALVAAGALDAATMIVGVGQQQWLPIRTVIPTASYRPTNEPLAIFSFVLSIIGFGCIGPLASIPAVVCGHVALSRLAKNLNLTGKGFAIAGLTIGYIGAVFWILWLTFYIFGLIMAAQDPRTFAD
jgi:hypothetical protein